VKVARARDAGNGARHWLLAEDQVPLTFSFSVQEFAFRQVATRDSVGIVVALSAVFGPVFHVPGGRIGMAWCTFPDPPGSPGPFKSH
jgi:hypothetical protein